MRDPNLRGRLLGRRPLFLDAENRGLEFKFRQFENYIGHTLDTTLVNFAMLLISLARPTGIEPVFPP